MSFDSILPRWLTNSGLFGLLSSVATTHTLRSEQRWAGWGYLAQNQKVWIYTPVCSGPMRGPGSRNSEFSKGHQIFCGERVEIGINSCKVFDPGLLFVNWTINTSRDSEILMKTLYNKQCLCILKFSRPQFLTGKYEKQSPTLREI